MKRVVKKSNSEVLTKGLNYIVNGNNIVLRDILFNEQKGFCAYTETFLGRTDKKEIDHFNPTLKGQPNDDYYNWFLIKAQWNSEKSSKWLKYQPVLHPTDTDFEDRIIYNHGDYFIAEPEDIKAKNLVALIKLDDPDLASERKKYINRKKEEIQLFGHSPNIFFKTLIEEEIESIRFIRAIEKEFNVNVFDLI